MGVISVSNRYTIKRSTLIITPILLYAFLAPLGNLTRISTMEGSFGVTTFLLLLIILTTPGISLTVLRRNQVFQAFTLLIIWLLMASLFSYDPFNSLINGASLIVYLSFAMVAYYCFSDERRVTWLFVAICLGGLLSSLFTLVDFIGVVDIPRINELEYTTRTQLGNIVQASGPFARRSAMGAYYSMIITIGALMAIYGFRASSRKRFFYSLTAISCTVGLMITHTRASLVATIVAIVFILVSQISKPLRFLKNLLYFAVGASAIIYILLQLFPDVFIAYQAQFRVDTVSSTDPFLSLSDSSRVYFALHALASVFQNPIGHGYSLMTNVTVPEFITDGSVDPHNIFSQIIWGAGIFGLLWLLWMCWRGAVSGTKLLRLKMLHIHSYQITLVLLGSMLAFLITNMAHTAISTGIAWLLFGALLRMAEQLSFQRSEIKEVKALGEVI